MNMLIINALQFCHVHFLLVPNSKKLFNVSDQKIPQANVTAAHPSFFFNQQHSASMLSGNTKTQGFR